MYVACGSQAKLLLNLKHRIEPIKQTSSIYSNKFKFKVQIALLSTCITIPCISCSSGAWKVIIANNVNKLAGPRNDGAYLFIAIIVYVLNNLSVLVFKTSLD